MGDDALSPLNSSRSQELGCLKRSTEIECGILAGFPGSYVRSIEVQIQARTREQFVRVIYLGSQTYSSLRLRAKRRNMVFELLSWSNEMKAESLNYHQAGWLRRIEGRGGYRSASVRSAPCVGAHPPATRAGESRSRW